jgi:hypothetical protein
VDQIQITLSLLTVAASGVVSGVVTFRLNAGRDARRMRREKLERLFLAHAGFVRQLETSWIPYFGVMSGQIDYNQALDMTIGQNANEEKHFESVEMLVSLYFPELEPALRRLVEIRDASAGIIATHKREYKRIGPHPTGAYQELRRLGEGLDAHRLSFRADLAKVARKLGAPSKHAA